MKQLKAIRLHAFACEECFIMMTGILVNKTRAQFVHLMHPTCSQSGQSVTVDVSKVTDPVVLEDVE